MSVEPWPSERVMDRADELLDDLGDGTAVEIGTEGMPRWPRRVLVRENGAVIRYVYREGFEGWERQVFQNLSTNAQGQVNRVQLWEALDPDKRLFSGAELIERPEYRVTTVYGQLLVKTRDREKRRCGRCWKRFRSTRACLIHLWDDHGIAEDPLENIVGDGQASLKVMS
ncbi:MAG: hypothetical protein SVU32_00740 [Candidatus Nanohaloarchaea archaeon]|nr:hypothetical protein [Candidatus Nanohaloarchaea archaeon]